MHGPTRIFWVNLIPFSVKAVEAVLLNGGGLSAVINRGHIAKAMLELLGNSKLPGK